MEDKDTVKNKRAKIIVSSDDELTDILRKISSLDDQNILLTFAEESDMLISPINLKVLQEVCDELKKNLILQIIQNTNGMRNAKIADVVTTDSPSEVDEALWLAAENQRTERKEILEKALKSNPKETKEAIENLNQKGEPVLQDSEYQQRVQEVISKAKNLSKKETSQVVEEDDLVFAVGEEINPQEEKGDMAKKTGESLVGKNFNNMGQLNNIKDEDTKEKKPKKAKKPRDKKKIKKLLIIFLVLVVLGLGGASTFAYFTLPFVEADIYIESKAIEVEKTFKGDPNIQNFSISKGEIPIKKESVEIGRSEDRETTGTGARGTKAEGIVDLKYWEGDEVEITAGTIIRVDDLEFEFSTDVVVPDAPNTTTGIAVRATEPGSDYNISAGQVFTVDGFDSDNLSAENQSSFSGGDSEEYDKMTQGDYDQLLEKLKDEAFEDGLEQLEKRLGGDWELIEETIEQKLDGSPSTNIPVGGEGSSFTMSIETTTEALFFNKDNILQSKEEIIRQVAVENNLFESDEELELELDSEIETEITVEEIEGDEVTIKFVAKGNVRPKIDTQKIEKSLLGKSWDEGLEILEGIQFSEEKPSATFSPEYFPNFLRHFPSREGRVIINTELIETEVVTEAEELEGEDESEEENDA